MKTFDFYLAGTFSKSASTLPVTNKYTGEVMAETYLANKQDLNSAIDLAVSAQKVFARWSSMQRYEALQFIAAELQKERNYFSELLAAEAAKPLPLAISEIDRAIQTFIIASEESKRFPSEVLSLDWTPNGRNKEGIVKYFPVGVVGAISPFNFPMNLAVHKLAPALAVGCSIILKPASSTPLSTLALSKIIAKCNYPPGTVSILPMNRDTGEQLATDDRINVLSFTGSPEIGWKLKEKSRKKKVVLELGGNAGVIISSTASIASAIEACFSGAFAYSGQICIHAQRFFVHESKYDAFCEEMILRAKALHNEDPLLASSKFSCMIDTDNARRAERWVNEAIEEGASLLCGGQRTNNFYEASILTNTKASMKVRSEEVFAPVICIEKYTGNIEEAIAMINESKFGLQAGVFTDSIEELNACYNDLDVGGVIHNAAPTLRFDQMPYGGIKESGLGREGVKYAMRDLLETKILVK